MAEPMRITTDIYEFQDHTFEIWARSDVPGIDVWRCTRCHLMLHVRKRLSAPLFFEAPNGIRTPDASKAPFDCPGFSRIQEGGGRLLDLWMYQGGLPRVYRANWTAMLMGPEGALLGVYSSDARGDQSLRRYVRCPSRRGRPGGGDGPSSRQLQRRRAALRDVLASRDAGMVSGRRDRKSRGGGLLRGLPGIGVSVLRNHRKGLCGWKRRTETDIAVARVAIARSLSSERSRALTTGRRSPRTRRDEYASHRGVSMESRPRRFRV